MVVNYFPLLSLRIYFRGDLNHGNRDDFLPNTKATALNSGETRSGLGNIWNRFHQVLEVIRHKNKGKIVHK